MSTISIFALSFAHMNSGQQTYLHSHAYHFDSAYPLAGRGIFRILPSCGTYICIPGRVFAGLFDVELRGAVERRAMMQIYTVVYGYNDNHLWQLTL